MAALIRCTLPKNGRLTQPLSSVVFSHQHQGIAFPISRKLYATPFGSRDKVVNDVHRRIDYNLGIPTQLFQSLSSTLESDGQWSEQDVGLLLFICSTGPFDCGTDKRLEHVENIWAKANEQGVIPSIKLFNIKLKAYCMNKKNFDPLDELMKLKTLGLNPDKVTYSLLIEGFCLKGNIDGANSVLEAMKTAQIAINVVVFNSFITGHLKAGSLNEAVNVFELIRSSGLNPNAHTYFRFASHFAEEGDMDSVTKYINEAEEGDVPLDQQMLLELYKTLVTSGHSAAAEKFLQTVTEKGIYSPSFMQKSCHLVSEGYLDAAIDLYTKMPSVDEGKIVSNSGSFLLRSMVVNDYSAEEILNTADKILEISPRALNAHKSALQFAYKEGKTDLAIQILDLMIAKNHKLKVPYMIPAVCSYRNQGNVEGVYKAVGMLLDIPISGIRDDKLDHLMKCCYPALQKCQQSRENIVQRFKNHEKLWNSIFFLDDINRKSCEEALQNAEGKELDGTVFQWSDSPSRFMKNLTQETDACVKALSLLHKQDKVYPESFYFLTARLAKFLMDNQEWASLEKFLDGFLKEELVLVQSLKQATSLKVAPKEIKNKIDKLCVGMDYNRTTNKQRPKDAQLLSQAQLEEMSAEEVRQYQKKYPDRFLPRFVLLKKAMEMNDLKSMQHILRELQASGFTLALVPTMRVISKLLRLKDAETALVHFDEMKKQVGESYKETVPLEIGELLMKQGDTEGAFNMINAARASKWPGDDRATSIKRSILCSMIENASSYEDVSRIHAAIFESEPLVKERDAESCHRSYVKKLNEMIEDDSEFVTAVVDLYQAHKSFPLSDLVLQRLIKKQDVENLKKVMDLGSLAYGSNFFHHKLAIGFVQCGMPARGATILKTPGLKLNEKVLYASCQYLAKEKLIESLESLVNILKDMSVSQTILLEKLVEGYVSVGNLSKATEAVQQFSVDYKDPPRSIIQFLVKAHKQSGQEAPEALLSLAFKQNQKPVAETKNDSSSSSSDSDQPMDEIKDNSNPSAATDKP